MRRLFLLITLASGCYESHGGSMRRDGGRPVDEFVFPPPVQESTFVIATLTIPESSGASAPGANLDGIDSGIGSGDPGSTCEEIQRDFSSFHDGFRGVDNAFSDLVGTINGLLADRTIDQNIADAIASGVMLIGLVVRGESVEAHLLSAIEPLIVDPGGIAPNQRFESVQLLSTGSARTTGDRTVVHFDQLSLPVPTWVVPFLPLAQLHEVEMRFSASASGLARGELGGWVLVDDAVVVAEEYSPGIGDTARPIFEGIADIDPILATPDVCSAFSTGMLFDAVPAVIDR
jgi:hypothetical protein